MDNKSEPSAQAIANSYVQDVVWVAECSAAWPRPGPSDGYHVGHITDKQNHLVSVLGFGLMGSLAYNQSCQHCA